MPFTFACRLSRNLAIVAVFFALSVRADTVDSSTLSNKFLLGYQGWHACAGDGSALNRYVHWTGADTIPGPDDLKHPIWPDLSEFPAQELFPTSGLLLGNGQPAKVYSCYVSNTVARHFKWMRDYGIDGVFMQRFIKDVYQGADWAALKTTNLVNVRAGAEAYGRVFCLEYDISNDDPSQVIGHLQADWSYLTGTLRLTNSTRYLKHKGKPVVGLWGLGFVGVNIPPADAQTIISHFKTGGCTVMGGVPHAWRALANDSQTNAAWLGVYHSFDVICPWAVDRYQTTNQVDSVAKNAYLGDLADLTPRGIDYLPVIFPGYSVLNLTQKNGTPRIGGRFYWRQGYDALSVGCNMLFGAMFDEIDEGTATYKLAPSMDTVPARTNMFALDIDGESLPSDWYLRVAGEITKALQKQVPLNEPLPISPSAELKVLSPVGGEVWTSGNLALVNWSTTGTLSSVRVDLSTDGAATWSCLAYGATNGSTLVRVPDAPSTACWVRVSGLSGTPAAWSTNRFTIQSAQTFPPAHLAPLWSLAPGSRAYVTTDAANTPNQRSIAYHALSNQVLVVSRTGQTSGLTVNVLNADTGQHLYQLNTTGISGGNIILLAIAVSDDGSVYAGNMSTSGGGIAAYKLYRWPDSGSTAMPALVFSGEPAARTDSVRWGDTLAAQGSDTNTQIMIDAYAANACAILTPANSSLTTWVSRSGPQDYASGSIGRSLQFGPANTFWQKRKGDRLQQSSFSLAGALSTTNLASHDWLPRSVGPVAIDFTRKLLAALNYCANTNGPDTVDLYDVANINNPALLGRYNLPVTQKANANFIGQLVFGGGKVFAIDGNNGIAAFSLVEALPRPAIQFTSSFIDSSHALHLTGSGAPGPDYRMEVSSNLLNWTTLAFLTNFTGSVQFTDTAPSHLPQRFYRLSSPP